MSVPAPSDGPADATATSRLGKTTLAVYADLAAALAGRHREAGWRIVGINGAQGAGKSTLAAVLVEQLRSGHGLHALTVSLDDFYLGRRAREQLAAAVHPLLITRGVPGTHEVDRGIDGLRALRELRPGTSCRLPVFSKADDDRLPQSRERVIEQRPDLVLFEGWCVGTPAQPPQALAPAVNALERDEDADGRWRRYVNDQLVGPYARWFAQLDGLIHLRIPGWAQVRSWRAEQERDTAARHGGHSALLDDAARERFLLHYERLTAHAAAVVPLRADGVVDIDHRHEAVGLTMTLRPRRQPQRA